MGSVNSKMWFREINTNCQGAGLIQVPLAHWTALPSALHTAATIGLNTKSSFTHPMCCMVFPVAACSMRCIWQSSGCPCCREVSSSAAALPFVSGKCCSSPKCKSLGKATAQIMVQAGMVSSDLLGALRSGAFLYSTTARQKYVPLCLHTPGISMTRNGLNVMKKVFSMCINSAPEFLHLKLWESEPDPKNVTGGPKLIC